MTSEQIVNVLGEITDLWKTIKRVPWIGNLYIHRYYEGRALNARGLSTHRSDKKQRYTKFFRLDDSSVSRMGVESGSYKRKNKLKLIHVTVIRYRIINISVKWVKNV